jgi:mycofactocin precursor
VISRSRVVGQNKKDRGGHVSEVIESQQEVSDDQVVDNEELLVEEVSIDGLCGVY